MDEDVINQLKGIVLQTNNTKTNDSIMIRTRSGVFQGKNAGESNQYFNETIFSDGKSLERFQRINVYNNADTYLVERLGKEPSTNFTKKTANRTADIMDATRPKDACPQANIAKLADILDDSTQINVNPPQPYSGINIYTMNAENVLFWQQVPYNTIRVIDVNDLNGTIYEENGQIMVPVHIGEHDIRNIYTVTDELTNFESAIMIKYFAVNFEGVTITRDLFNVIEKYFKDRRVWFNHSPTSANMIRQTSRKELVQGDAILNVPLLTFFGPPLQL